MVSYGKFKNFTSLSLALSAIWNRHLVINSAVARFYGVHDSNKPAERTQGLQDFGLIPEHKGPIEYDEFDKGNLKTFTMKEYSRGLKIPYKLIKDEEYGIISNMLAKRALAFSRTVTYHMSATFNNAFAAVGDDYKAADGKALCATTGRNTGKAVLANKGTDPLTHDSVVATRQTMRQLKDANGLVLQVNPDTIIVPVLLEDKADEIVNSVKRSDNANNATNSNRKMQVEVDPLLTDDTNWFMADSQLAPMHLHWWWNEHPSFAVHPASDYDLELRTRGYMRYIFGADDHIWIHGHEVAG